MKVSLILACAGKGQRAGFEKNKLLVELENGKTPLELALGKFIDSGKIDQYVITASQQDFEAIKQLVPPYCIVVLGGETRTESVLSALSVVSGDVVLIHDGARPLVTIQSVLNCIEETVKNGAAALGTPVKDTIKSSDSEGFIKDMFLYELANHEYCITYDLEDTLDALCLTVDEINSDKRLLRGLEKALSQYLKDLESKRE